MNVLCIHDYWLHIKWEIYEDIWWYLYNTITHEVYEDQEWYRKYPDYFIEIIPDIDIWKTSIEIKVSALCRRHTKLLKDKSIIEKELELVLGLIIKYEEL